MNRRDYHPMSGMLTLREAMDRLLEDSVVSGGSLEGSTLQMPLDLFETGDTLTARASLPGVKPEDIDITVTGDTLTLRAALRDHAPSGADRRYHQREHRHGTVARSLTLPVEVQPDKVEASFEHGMLTLTMPKAARLQPRSIKINAHGAVTPITAQSTGERTSGTTGAGATNPAGGGRAGESSAPDTEYVSTEDRGTAGSAPTATSKAGAASGGPSDMDADATPSPS